jgi:hypothetical protein
MIAFMGEFSPGNIGIGRHNVAWDTYAPHGMSNNTWYHLAISRSNSDLHVFVDGNEVSGSPFSNSNAYNTSVVYIGASPGVNYLGGHIDELRISKGVARYTTTFDPPLSPLLPSAKDEDCVLLLHFDEADGATRSPDYSLGGADSPHETAFNNNSQIDTAQYKFGPSSLLLDGDNDFVSFLASADFNMQGVTTWTVECWFRANALPSTTSSIVHFVSGDDQPQHGLHVHVYSTGQLRVDNGLAEGFISDTGIITTGQWYHVAVVRSGSSLEVFLEGTSL